MKRYDTILFDADDTLFDFQRCEREAFFRTAEVLGWDADEQCLERYREISTELWHRVEGGILSPKELKTERFRCLFGNDTSWDHVAATSAQYLEELGAQTHLFPGVLDLVGNLSGQYRLAVLTNGFESVQSRRMRKSGLDRYFTAVFVSETLGYSKPHPQAFALALASLHSVPSRTLMVGDSLTSDIRGALNAGLDACWLDRNRTDLSPEGVTFVIPCIDALGDLLRCGPS